MWSGRLAARLEELQAFDRAARDRRLSLRAEMEAKYVDERKKEHEEIEIWSVSVYVCTFRA